ncbi:MAG: sigma-70 family RNA polymerase sigma factor [Candidatus Magnetomorum sp.]|nr:sigma-70 family RNA polymerase sigma factor [Candidatus Magnetomorum sp.]
MINQHRQRSYTHSFVEAKSPYGLHIYFKDMKRYHLITREKERELAIRIQRYNDPVAEAELIHSNLRLVVKIAINFQKMFRLHLQDLIQEGNIGLSKAARKFDPDKNVKFSYYASYWIKAYILRYIMENWSIVKIGTTQKQRLLFFNLNKVKQKFREDQDFDISEFHLFKNKGISEFDINEMDQRLNSGDASLNSPAMKDSKQEKVDTLPERAKAVDEQLAHEEFQKFLKEGLLAFRKELNPRDLEIFESRMVSDSPLTLRQLGEKFGVSRERIRQVEKRIMNRIKDYFIKNYGDRIIS